MLTATTGSIPTAIDTAASWLLQGSVRLALQIIEATVADGWHRI